MTLEESIWLYILALAVGVILVAVWAVNEERRRK